MKTDEVTSIKGLCIAVHE